MKPKALKPKHAGWSGKASGSKLFAHGSPLVEISKPIYGGAFLAHADSKAVFVPFALPGEQVRIRITQSKSGYSTADLAEVIAPSLQRIHPRCPHFGMCGGCHYQHTDYQNQLNFKGAILRETLVRGGVEAPAEIEVVSADPWAYRNRIRLALDAGGNPGYRGRHSHAVIPIGQCPIAAPLLLSAASAASQILQRVPANLRPHELSLFCDPTESALMVTLFAAESAGVRLEPLARALHDRVPVLESAQLAADGRPGHPPRTLEEWGAQSITYDAAGCKYRVDQGAFFQVNRRLVDALVELVLGGQQGGLAWDLFAGVGLFARKLAERFAEVVAVESAPPSAAALEANLAATNGRAVRSSTLDFLRRAVRGKRPDLIVMDPPRTGLQKDVVMLLQEVGAQKVVYVSCDPATLARDLRALIGFGYAIDSMTLVDLFPQTFHLETVVHLRRS